MSIPANLGAGLAGPYPRRIQWEDAAITGRYTIFSVNLEQVHVRSMFSRGLRLELVAALGVALAIPATAVSAESARGIATQTTMTAETHDLGGHTETTLNITVNGEDGLPASGAVVIKDHGKPLAGSALDAEGNGKATVQLLGGDHSLSATYAGDATHLVSVSPASTVHALVGSTPDFSITIAPTTLSLVQGQSGAVIASVNPVNAASLTAPMFVTLSCSGIPDQTKCAFTPENVQILPNAKTAVTSSMVLSTQAPSLTSSVPSTRSANPVAWAVLLPGTLGLVSLAFGARRRRWLNRVVLMALVGFVAVLGASACAPLYNYREHGPSQNRPTPAGTYNVTVTAQSSNGVTATTRFTQLVLTVTAQ